MLTTTDKFLQILVLLNHTAKVYFKAEKIQDSSLKVLMLDQGLRLRAQAILLYNSNKSVLHESSVKFVESHPTLKKFRPLLMGRERSLKEAAIERERLNALTLEKLRIETVSKFLKDFDDESY